MFEPLTRRRLLRSATAGAVPVLSGCSGVLPGSSDGTTDPDAGTDSYGIFLANDLEKAATVQIEVALPFDDETAFDETVEIATGKSKEWNQVITGEKEWAVSGELKDPDTVDRLSSDSLWITPGSEDAPDVENVRVEVKRVEAGGGTVLINVTHEGE